MSSGKEDITERMNRISADIREGQVHPVDGRRAITHELLDVLLDGFMCPLEWGPLALEHFGAEATIAALITAHGNEEAALLAFARVVQHSFHGFELDQQTPQGTLRQQVTKVFEFRRIALDDLARLRDATNTLVQ